MKNLLFIALFLFAFSCKKQEAEPSTPITPVTTQSADCRIQENSITTQKDITRFVYTYDRDGFISAYRVIVTRIPTGNVSLVLLQLFDGYTYATYKDGLLIKLTDGQSFEEGYEYTNGALSKIKIVKEDNPSYKGYEIEVITDSKKQIIEMVDNKGTRTRVSRDGLGNIVQITKHDMNDNNKVFYQMQRSDFDGKKTPYGLMKGWQFDHLQYYVDYITNPTFSVGAGGNARKEKIYENGILTKDFEYTYFYSTDGYPISVEKNDLKNNTKETANYSLVNCK